MAVARRDGGLIVVERSGTVRGACLLLWLGIGLGCALLFEILSGNATPFI